MFKLWLPWAAWLVLVSPLALDETYSFGVLNQQNLQLTTERWQPILRYVKEKTDIGLTLRLGPTVADTDARMGRGEFDFMYTNHNFQPEYDGLGYRVLARWAGEPIRCAIVVPPDSPIRRLEDLQGKRVAYANPDAFVAYAVPKVLLRGRGIEVREIFAGNQDAALNQVRFRQVEAAAVNSRFLREYEEKSRAGLRVLFESEPYPDLAVIVHPRVPAADRDKVRAALIGMAEDPSAIPILAKAKSPGFAPADDGDYEAVRRVYRLLGQ